MILTTPRLLLRPPQRGDERALHPILSDPEVASLLNKEVHTDVADTAAYLLRGTRLITTGRGFCWVITTKADNTVVGSISAVQDSTGPHAVVLGGYLSRQCWRTGYGTEAGTVVLDWLRSQPSIYRIGAHTDAANEAVAALLQKLGLAREGTLRRYWPARDGQEPRDVHVWAWTC